MDARKENTGLHGEKALRSRAHAGQSGRKGQARRSSLVRYLVTGYTFLVAYASLYPFTDWLAPQSGLLDFLFESWPRYYSTADLTLNVLGYVPFGFLLALALLPFFSATVTAVAATVAGSLLSLVMEILQQFITVRVASNLDLLTNGLGSMLGSLLAVTLGERWLLSGRLYHWRQRVFLQGRIIDTGFVILALWLFTQLNPDVWLFGNGEMRTLLPAGAGLIFRPEAYRWLETGVTAFNLAGVALCVRALARDEQEVVGPIFALFAAALVLKAGAATALYRPGTAALWVTPGCLLGIPIGIGIYLALAWMNRVGVIIGSVVCIAAGAWLVNVAPENPYLAASVRTWRHGHFLSFSGVTNMVSAVWPALMLAYLVRFAVLFRKPG